MTDQPDQQPKTGQAVAIVATLGVALFAAGLTISNLATITIGVAIVTAISLVDLVSSTGIEH